MKGHERKFVIVTCLIFWWVLVAAWTYTYDTATPLGSDAPSVIDDRIREVKAAVQERMNVEHYWALTGTEVSDAAAGQHRYLEFYGPISTPTYAANKGFVYSKDVSSVVELHWLDESNNELQLTSGGTINITSADLVGTLASNTYFTCVDNAGTGTANLIKADANDDAVLPDGAELATSGAPTTDQAIANKKYVDDNVGSANYTPTSYANEESVTLPNGLIMKFGTATTLTAQTDKTITFGTAFPTACKTAVVTGGDSDPSVDDFISAHTLAAASFKIQSRLSMGSVHWIAIGY